MRVLSHRRMNARMVPESPLDDPEYANFAWVRYKRLMWLMTGITSIVLVVACVILYRAGSMVSVHFYIATVVGIGFAMMLMSALMGLVFLSSGSGHDGVMRNTPEED